jgi:hypothetical protein
VNEAGNRAQAEAAGRTQAVHSRDDAITLSVLADEERLEHAEPLDRLLEILQVCDLVGRRLDVRHRNLLDRPERGISHQLLDVVPSVAHAERRGKAFAAPWSGNDIFAIDVRIYEL